jgi:hypothetical protein
MQADEKTGDPAESRYEPPAVTEVGSVASLTRADDSVQPDFGTQPDT